MVGITEKRNPGQIIPARSSRPDHPGQIIPVRPSGPDMIWIGARNPSPIGAANFLWDDTPPSMMPPSIMPPSIMAPFTREKIPCWTKGWFAQPLSACDAELQPGGYSAPGQAPWFKGPYFSAFSACFAS
jgi:hypothetical protein